jgi:transcription-repair coupling factor (superfamily II helicase)
MRKKALKKSHLRHGPHSCVVKNQIITENAFNHPNQALCGSATLRLCVKIRTSPNPTTHSLPRTLSPTPPPPSPPPPPPSPQISYSLPTPAPPLRPPRSLAMKPRNWLELPALKSLDPLCKAPAPRVVACALGSLRSLAIARLIQRRKTSALILTASEEEARWLAADLAALLGDELVFVNPPLDYGGDSNRGLDAWGLLADRIALLQNSAHRILISSVASLLERVPSPAFIKDSALRIRLGDELDLPHWSRTLASRGHRRVPIVEAPGDFAVRGGILDLFPVGAEWPLRVELFGDTVDSIRRFDPVDQRSLPDGKIPELNILAISVGDYINARRSPDSVSLLNFLPPDLSLFVCGHREVDEAAQKARSRGDSLDLLELIELQNALQSHWRVDLEAWQVLDQNSKVIDLAARRVDIAMGNANEFTSELRARLQEGDEVILLAPAQPDEDRLRRHIQKVDPRLLEDPRVKIERGDLGRGFRLPNERLTVLTCAQLFDRMRAGGVHRTVHSSELGQGKEITSLGDLTIGAPVVHVVHGIGLFRGLTSIEVEGQPREQLMIEYRDKALLYVPVDRIGLVRHYIGASDAPPTLSKLGTSSWEKKRAKVEKACIDLASDLIEIQAARSVQHGHAFPPDDDEVFAFEGAFPFEETIDQARAIAEVKEDLQKPTPMDRLICGDVGFGKTEVALRAAFKVANAGRQVAILAPTTVLAHQHYRSFIQRCSSFPVIVDVISRFRERSAQKDTLQRLAEGQVDIIIGTHRLLSQDVKFKDLGLVIVDEEQKFGVAHKEMMKALRRTVDVLTLTATPIPRTLHMALSGVRDISVIASPPRGRIPVRSMVTRFSENLIERAINEELARGGQVYFVHDRVESIEKMAALIMERCPKARVTVVHGQMDEHSLESNMMAFVEGEVDVIVATKIIENGLDVPRANTLIVNRADRFGLSELHQIRGRVGRHRVQAYAYFLLPREGVITDIAERRLRAIEEYSELGAGFRIALRDLELRGAGNMLGSEQSGHIAEVGYDLYCRLLRKAVDDARRRRARGEDISRGPRLPMRQAEADKRAQNPAPSPKLSTKSDDSVNLELETGSVELGFRVPAGIPPDYLDDVRLKIEVYRKLSSSNKLEELEALRAELLDRFGPMPQTLKSLFALRALRLLAVHAGVTRIYRQDAVLVLHFQDKQLLQAALYGHRFRLQFAQRGHEEVAQLVLSDPQAEEAAVLDFALEVFSAIDRQGTLRERLRFGNVSPAANKPEPQKPQRTKPQQSKSTQGGRDDSHFGGRPDQNLRQPPRKKGRSPSGGDLQRRAGGAVRDPGPKRRR